MIMHECNFLSIMVDLTDCSYIIMQRSGKAVIKEAKLYKQTKRKLPQIILTATIKLVNREYHVHV